MSKIRPRTRFIRSANLERDADTSGIQSYVPTARSVDLVTRVLAGWSDAAASRAWSVSGPYGSGKSSIALVLDGLLSSASSNSRVHSAETLVAVDPDISGYLDKAHQLRGSDKGGFIRAFATADPEPVTTTVLRALQRGVRRYWGGRGRKPRASARIDALLERAFAGDLPAPGVVIQVVAELCSHAPVMIVIDEFGKNLDFLREAKGGAGDLFVLQSLAESSSGRNSLPLGILTMQHMAFDDYLSAGSASQRREWTKVQGRFEDLLYLDSADQTIALMGRVFEASWSSGERRRVHSWARSGIERLRALGLSDRIEDPHLMASMYPLHPLVAAALPDLCRRYGQNERTLFSFLTHDEPSAVGEFLRLREHASFGELPVVRLTDVFDYFVGSVTPSLGSSPESARWFEIRDRLEQAIGLTQAETEVLKTIGILNLVGQGGSLRASSALVREALQPAEWATSDADITNTILSLEHKSFLTYRRFADEYRLWQGSDTDLDARAEFARRAYMDVPLGVLVQRLGPLTPVVASRHSQERGIVRVFARVVLDADHIDLGTLAAEAGDGDGLIVYWTQTRDVQPLGNAPIPVVIIRAPQLQDLRTGLVDAAASQDVLDSGDLDWVARREMEERAAFAAAKVRADLESALGVEDRPILIMDRVLEALPAVASASELTSRVADAAYAKAPRIRNEMLARRTMTSQAARARIDLLSAMVESRSLPALGISGYGPERSLYDAVLLQEGMHRFDGEKWLIAPPTSQSSFAPAWQLIDTIVRRHADEATPLVVADIEAELRLPPFGMKAPAFPILLTAYLLHTSDQVAIYQDGTFQPRVTPDLLERLTKAPHRFTLRHLEVKGERVGVLRALAREFELTVTSSSKRQAAPVLSVVGPLLEMVRQLPEYTLRSAPLSERAAATRAALMSAREPDRLLYDDLPTALGLSPIAVNSSTSESEAFAATLREVMTELVNAYPDLLESIADRVAEGISLHQRNTLKVEAAARARPLLRVVAEPRLRALLFALASDTLDDDDWLEAVALAISERPPRMWREADHERFPAACSASLAALRRVEALHFEFREHSRVGAIARRVNVTAPNGTESSTVVWIEENELPTLRRLLAQTKEHFDEAFPGLGRDALLGALAESMVSKEELGADHDGGTKSQDEEIARWTVNRKADMS